MNIFPHIVDTPPETPAPVLTETPYLIRKGVTIDYNRHALHGTLFLVDKSFFFKIYGRFFDIPTAEASRMVVDRRYFIIMHGIFGTSWISQEQVFSDENISGDFIAITDNPEVMETKDVLGMMYEKKKHISFYRATSDQEDLIILKQLTFEFSPKFEDLALRKRCMTNCGTQRLVSIPDFYYEEMYGLKYPQVEIDNGTYAVDGSPGYDRFNGPLACEENKTDIERLEDELWCRHELDMKSSKQQYEVHADRGAEPWQPWMMFAH